jgi:hypothetical protein
MQAFENILKNNKQIQCVLKKINPQQSLTGGLISWWTHQDLNLGPKDYEGRHPNENH